VFWEAFGQAGCGATRKHRGARENRFQEALAKSIAPGSTPTLRCEVHRDLRYLLDAVTNWRATENNGERELVESQSTSETDMPPNFAFQA
jgi:hypothetical protein